MCIHVIQYERSNCIGFSSGAMEIRCVHYRSSDGEVWSSETVFLRQHLGYWGQYGAGGTVVVYLSLTSLTKDSSPLPCGSQIKITSITSKLPRSHIYIYIYIYIYI